MTEDPYKYIPAYISPLSHDDHARLGRIAVLWGHIDRMLTDLIRGIPELSNEKVIHKPLGQKLSHIQNNVESINDTILKENLDELCRVLSENINARNHAMHGCWGYRIDDTNLSFQVAARDERTPSEPLRPEQLVSLEKNLCECSRICFDTFWQTISEQAIIRDVNRFIHGPGDLPEWAETHLRSNPLQRDRFANSKVEGELLYFENPYGT